MPVVRVILSLFAVATLLATLFQFYPAEPGRIFPQRHLVQLRNDDGTGFDDKVNKEVSYWKTRIVRVGGTAAYAELVDSISALDNPSQHIAAHAFGEALYKTEGLRGLSVCDARFGQGCGHSFFGFAIRDHGITAGLAQLGRQCSEEPDVSNKRTCEHGLGHGIQSYLGYTPADLEDSLVACKTIQGHTNLGMGCFGGAFMEYSLRTMIRADGVSARVLSADTTYQPCTQVSEEYRAACMFWQPFWWRVALKSQQGHDVTGMYTVMGDYCRQADKLFPSGATYCFEGLGYDAPIVLNLDARATADACATISVRAAERITCWSWALLQLNKTDREKSAARVCAGLQGAEEEYCREHNLDYIDLSKDIDDEVL